MFGRDDIDAMGERRTGQIGIEQGNHTADPGDAQPDGHVFGPVRHQQADAIAFAETLVERPSGISVRPLGERTIGQALAVGEQGRRVAELRGEFLDHRGKNAIGMAGDGRRQLERAHPGFGSGTVPLLAGLSLEASVMPYCPRRP